MTILLITDIQIYKLFFIIPNLSLPIRIVDYEGLKLILDQKLLDLGSETAGP